MHLFSLKSKFTFFLLVAALCIFSVGAWWSVRLLVWSEVDARLRANADRIEAGIAERMSAQGAMLFQLRSHFAGDMAPGRAEFKRIVDAAELLPRNPGLRYIGYAPVTATNSGGQSARITLAEPADWRRRELIGLDMLAEGGQKEAYFSAAQSGDAAVGSASLLLSGRQGEGGRGFVFLLPVFSGDHKVGGPSRQPDGLLYSVFDSKDFFEDIFGAPSLKKETVNFSLEMAEAGPLYGRFDLGDPEAEGHATIRREIPVWGKRLTLTVRPLQRFYSFGDRYLALIVGLGAALVSCMIMIVMRASQNQLEFETLAKEASMAAAHESRRQVENLRRLNEFDHSLSGELDTGVLVEKFSAIVNRLAEIDSSFIFFRESAKDKPLKLISFRGVEKGDFRTESLTDAWLEKMATQSLVLRKGSPGADEVLDSLIRGRAAFSDWFLSLIYTREGGRCGLIFAAKKNGARFSDVEKELFESIVSQFASSTEIAQLFVRVEDANRAKSAFLANMSHEIRTPLGAVIGFSEMMARDDISPQHRSELSAHVRKNGEQLTCIIDDILDLAKVEAGKMKMERKRTSLPSVLHELHSVMLLRSRDKKIHFSIDTVGRVPAHIDTDEVRLKQILMNIVGNAIKFTDKGSVKLVVRHLAGGDGQNFLAFTVRDTGIGISDDNQAGLFRPFSQADMSSTRRFGGSGLGLVLSRRLAQELGGNVELVESIQGQGSTFEAKVEVGPLKQTEWLENLFPKLSQVPTLLPRGVPRLDGAKILLVEDSEDNQDIFRYFLESSGANAKIVTDGNEAVKAAAHEDFDLILMDIQIPGIDGKEATRRIRQQGFKPPIVALTAHAMQEERQSCLNAGCVGQITKPISGEALVGQVADYLRRA